MGTGSCLLWPKNFSILQFTRTLLVSLLPIGFMTACYSSRPSDSQARKVAETHLYPLTQMGAKVGDFRRLSAESGERDGQKFYLYRYLAAAKLPAGIAWQSASGSRAAFAQGERFVKDTGQIGSVRVGHFTPLPKGTTAVIKGTIVFRLARKGWLLANVVPDTTRVRYCTDEGPADCYRKLGWDTLE